MKHHLNDKNRLTLDLNYYKDEITINRLYELSRQFPENEELLKAIDLILEYVE